MEKRVDVNGTKIYRACKYKAPPYKLLKEYELIGMTQEKIQSNGQILENVVSHFLQAQVNVVNITCGSQATRYELEVPEGTSVKAIELRCVDIQYELALFDRVRVETSNSKRTVYIDIPNKNKSIVGLREVISSPAFVNRKSNLAFAVGKDIGGEPIVYDLTQITSLLIAGESGSGKSTWLNGFIISLICKSSPSDLKFIFIPSKQTKLDVFYAMPHMLLEKPVATITEALRALQFIDNEVERRYNILQMYGCSSLSEYNSLPDVVNGVLGKLPYIVIIIDELEELMRSNMSREIEGKIYRITRLAKAAGIRLIAATQHASSDVLTGTIKTNMVNRISFKLPEPLDSRIVLDMQGAESLIGNGDMLFYPVEAHDPMRVQGPYINNKEVRAVVDFLCQNYECDFDASAEKFVFNVENNNKEEMDPLLPHIMAYTIKTNQISASNVQRKFSIGYARSYRIINDMEARGYIGPSTGDSKPRDILMTAEEFNKAFGHDINDDL